MSKDTKRLILQNAKLLFTEKGYNAVSIQDIAVQCGISKGNLTYHFKKKEQILEALLDEPADKRFFLPAQTPEELDRIFAHQQDVVQSNAYYFWHHAQMGQISEKIRNQQKAINTEIRELYKASIHNLTANGFMNEQDGKGRKLTGDTLELVLDALVMGIIYWMPYHQSEPTERSPLAQDALVRYCRNQLEPWLVTR